MSEVGLLAEVAENEGPKSCKLWRRITGFYRDNFPTDTATFNVRISFLAMTCSLTLAYVPMSQYFSYINLIILVHLLLIAGATYQLHYGFEIGDKTQFMPWMLLKFFEIIVTLSTGSYFLHRHLTDTPFYGQHLNPWKYVVMGFLIVIAAINIWIYVIVIIQWKKLRNGDPKRFSIFDIWSALKEFYHNNFPTDSASFNTRIPLLAMVCSLTLAYIPMAQLYFVRTMCFAYLLVISGATYQLYYGLKIGDKKQLTPWMSLKFIEIILMMTIGSYYLVMHIVDPSYTASYKPDAWTYIIISFLLKIAVMNIWIYFVVIGQWNKLRKEENVARMLEVFNPNSFEKAEPELVLTN